MIGVRKCLDWIFTQRELKILDDTLPEFSRKKRMQDDEEEEDEEGKLGKETVRQHYLIPAVYLSLGTTIYICCVWITTKLIKLIINKNIKLTQEYLVFCKVPDR